MRVRHQNKLVRSILAILLIFQVGAAYALPADFHLNLCVGYDGHFDISPDECSTVDQEADLANEENHHDDCLDVSLGCVALDDVHPRPVRACQSQTKGNRLVAPLSLSQQSIALTFKLHPSYGSQPNLSRGALPALPLVSLRSVVLLI